ncbi:MAG: FtsW/RodA/SpoVE family cell cycle protein [Candidatus Shapirobacteria bacterium]
MLPSALIILFGIQLLMVSSVSPSLVPRQIISWLIGIVLFFIGKQANYRQLYQYRFHILIAALVFVILPIIFGELTRGSHRWISIGPLNLQPSEIIKPLLMTFFSFNHLPILGFLPILVVLLQPDLGTSLTLFCLAIPLIFINKTNFYRFLLVTLFFIVLSPFVYQYGLKPYQRQRITNFLEPRSDPTGAGYNVIQSQIAIGSGGLLGKGFKQGTQGQLKFLPEKHTDFIFAATAEERGFVGIFLLIGSYFLLLRGLLAKFKSLTYFPQKVFTLGITFSIWFQIVVNIGMNLGLLPVTGIPLPFISVGGSSIMALLFALGIIYSV